MTQASTPRSIPGRIVVYVVYFAFFGSIGVTILASILSSLYGKAPTHHLGSLTPNETAWCVRRVEGLRDELEGQVTLELDHPRHGSDPLARWRLWEEGWSTKLRQARTRCASNDPTLDHAFGALRDLYVSYEKGLEQIVHTRTTLANRFDSLLQELVPLEH